MSPIRIAPIALALLASPAAAAEIQIASQGPVIELTVTEMADAKPDVAQVSAGVTTRAMTANEAARLNAQRMDRVVAKLRELGVPREDIQTANFSLNAQWNHRAGGQPVFSGYDVSNQVNVKLRDMAKIGTVLDALIAAGANSVHGPNFMIEDDRLPKAAARKAAFASADVRGRELAGLAGYRSVRLLEVSETFANMRSRAGNDMMVMAVSAERGSAATHIEPGQVGVAATLTVKYEMVR